MRLNWLIACGVAAVSMVPSLRAQVELDKIVGRVGERIITQSDVRQARELKLVDDVSSDDAVRRALENRLLILNEAARATSLPPSAEGDLAARRGAWEASLGGPAAAASRLRQSGMSDSALQAWLREDVLIQAYLARQFGRLPPADRDRAVGDWLSRLRLRAEVH